ncbi:MAG: hypothetical protein AUJ31_02315 [Parcubacteria group bacterium CG1_02_39_15]|nr:MAG: hypothetical protein AUJ31_02315 [Parcubacteria group bacterium CG1_02_39_15]
MLRVVNLISGQGTTNSAILKAESPGGRLYGLAETVALIFSSPLAPGRLKAERKGFSKSNIWVVHPDTWRWGKGLLEILDKYRPDFFHQLGWMPLTPLEVVECYNGLNQHLGPGGKWMHGVRRIYTHMRFCELIGEQRPIPVFCQRVATKYDEGSVIYLQYEDLLPNESPEEAAKRLIEIEHRVQIEALYRLATNSIKEQPVPRLALSSREEEILLRVKKEARDRYPPEYLIKP